MLNTDYLNIKSINSQQKPRNLTRFEFSGKHSLRQKGNTHKSVQSSALHSKTGRWLTKT